MVRNMDFSFATANEISRELGARLKIVRIAHGLTQPELAKKAGVSLSTVRNLARTGDCSLGTLIKVAQAMGLERGFGELFKPAIQSIAELAQIARKSTRLNSSH